MREFSKKISTYSTLKLAGHVNIFMGHVDTLIMTKIIKKIYIKWSIPKSKKKF